MSTTSFTNTLDKPATPTSKSSIIWMDYLRTLATLAVVVVHISWIARSTGIHADLVYGAITRFCVPIFIMLSGALLTRKDYDLSDFLCTKFMRIVLPFLFWTFIYAAYNTLVYFKANQQVSFTDLVKRLYGLIQSQNGISQHFWYMYIIIPIYLLFPLLGPAIRRASRQTILFYISIWFIMLFFEYEPLKKYYIDLDFRYFTGYLGYFILGFFLFNYSFHHERLFGWLLFILGLTVTIIGTYYLSNHEGSFNHLFYEYLTPNVACLASGIFLLFKHIPNLNNDSILHKSQAFVANHSYGIYLVHILILIAFSIFGINVKMGSPFITIPLISILCLFVSGVVVWAVRRMPFGHLIAG